MAYTSNTGFRFRKALYSTLDSPEPQRFRLANSATVRVGDAIRINTGGFAVTSGASNPIVGFAVGFVDDQGLNPFSLIYDVTVPNVTLTNQDQVTTASDNQTRTHYMQVEVAMDPGGEMLWYNLANGALTQANTLQMFNLTANGQQVDQATASDSTGVVQLIERDPDNDGNTSKGLFRIVIDQLPNFVSNATAVRSA